MKTDPNCAEGEVALPALVRILEWAEKEKDSHFEAWLNKPCSEKHKTIYLAHSEAMRVVAAKIRSLMPNAEALAPGAEDPDNT